MDQNLPAKTRRALTRAGLPALPAIIANAGDQAARRFLEFFTAQIRNPNTREAYGRAVARFLAWLEERGVTELDQVEPLLVAAYIEQLGRELSKPSVKQHLAAIRMLFDWLTSGGIVRFNPASSVRGPKYVVRRGKTPVLEDDQTQELLDSIPADTAVGLRDRALLSVMAYNFARIGAVLAMKVGDYYQDGKRWSFRLHEKGGKDHPLPAHHIAEAAVDAYLEAAGIAGEKNTPLFRSARGRSGELTEKPMSRSDALRMIKRRALAAGLPASTCNHTFRATAITNFRRNGGSRGKAAQLAAHADERTTRLYDRSDDPITLDEIERVNYRSAE